MNVLDAIYDFQLELLSEDWVDSVWSSDFSGENVIPDEYLLQVEDKDFSECMLQLIAAIKNWKGNGRDSFVSSDSRSNSPPPESIRKTWQALSECKIDHKPLLCLLSTFFRSDTNELKDDRQRHLAFTACRLYLNLVSIPGALAFNVFHSILFDQALMVLKLGNIFTNLNTSKKVQKNSKGKKKQQVSNNEEEEENDDHNSSISFTDSEKKNILDAIQLLLCDLSFCLKTLKLKDETDSVVNLIQLLVGLTRLDAKTNDFVRNSREATKTIVRKAYCILEELCEPEQGDVEQTMLSIMSFFLPTLVINEQNFKMSLDESVEVKEHTFSFIHKVLHKYGNEAAPAVKALFQQMCVRMPEKADIRGVGIPEIVDFFKSFPSSVRQELILWIICFSHEDMVRYRTCAIDLISKLLNVSDKTNDDEGQQPRQTEDVRTDELFREKELLVKLMFTAVLSRIGDVSALVRQKALGILVNLITSNQPEIKKIIDVVFIPSESNDDREEREFFDFVVFFKQKEDLSLPTNPFPSGNFLLNCVEKLTLDQRVYVRKNALSVIANLCLRYEELITGNRIKMLVDSCRDSSVLIRKVISKYLTDLVLKYPESSDFVKAWVRGVISLIADNEVKCQENAVEYTRVVILNNLEMHGKETSPSANLPWLVLNEIERQRKRSLFRFSCKSWAQKRFVTGNLFKIIKSHIATENNSLAWFLIVCVSEFQDFPFPRLIYDYYFDNIHSGQNVDEYLSQLVIESLFLNWRKLDPQSLEELYSKLSSALENFSVAVPLIRRTLDICFQMKKDETQELCAKLTEVCEGYIEKRIVPDCTRHINEQAIAKYIYTLGDTVQYCPGVRTDTINCLANLIDPNFITDENVQKWEGSASANVRAIAVVTLGKICLQDLIVAKTYSPVLGSLFKNPASPEPVKINALIALSDLCVRFSTVVENYLGSMCVTLKDPSTNVRLNTLKLLMQLIQEDYIKLKPSLFYYILTMILDPSPIIRELVESFIVTSVINKVSGILANNYVGAILFFNGFEGKEGFSVETISPMERAVFSLAGVSNFKNRGKIYRFMLTHMQDDHRFKSCNRICFDILEEAVEEDGKIGFDLKGMAVIKDALYSLACEEMRLEHLRKEDGHEEDKESEGPANVVCGIAQKVFLSQVVKRNYIDNVVPVIAKLKRLLLERKSPLVRDLMICLRELMKDYKEEINEILSTDPELAAEVALDLKNVSVQDIISEDYDDLNLKEVRIECEKLSDRALFEVMNIPNAVAEGESSPSSSPPSRAPSILPVSGQVETSSFTDEVPIISASSIAINSTVSASLSESSSNDNRNNKLSRLSQVEETLESSNSNDESSKKRRSHEALDSSPPEYKDETILKDKEKNKSKRKKKK